MIYEITPLPRLRLSTKKIIVFCSVIIISFEVGKYPMSALLVKAGNKFQTIV